MEEQAAIDRILETENLTDALEDEQANRLLNWGIQRVPGLVGGVADDEFAGGKVNQLMAVMRKINQLIGGRESKTVDELAADIQALAERYQGAFGSAPQTSSAEYIAFAGQIAEKPADEALEALIEWLGPAGHG